MSCLATNGLARTTGTKERSLRRRGRMHIKYALFVALVVVINFLKDNP